MSILYGHREDKRRKGKIDMKIRIRVIIIGFTLVCSLFLSGCHTTAGFGEDMSEGGQAITKAASK